MTSNQIQEAVARIQEKLSRAAERAGRKPEDVALMAVSKFHPAEEIAAAIDAGLCLFGENRVQEAAEKFPQLYETYAGSIQLHLIGSLQRNKVKQILPLASCIQSVDRLELISELNKQLAKMKKTTDILLEYHTGETSKSGFLSADEVFRAIDSISEYRLKNPEETHGVQLRGFMTMAPFTDDKSAIRASFRRLTELQRQVKQRFPHLEVPVLSMGMSSDFEIAVEEGSTLVRIGTAIFGERTAT